MTVQYSRTRQMVLAAFLTGFLVASGASASMVKVVSRGDSNATYVLDMLKLALDRSDSNYELIVENADWSPARLEIGVHEGDIDLFWAATSPSLEEKLLPVRVPLYKGLLGHRLLMVRGSERERFLSVNTAEDLRQIVLGQGREWSDTAILRANGLTVEAATKHESLFYMLDGGRFDAFPRGVLEPWAEIAARPDLDLAVEPHLLIRYRMPYYVFVSPTRPKLAEALRRGFEVALDDGSFDARFHGDAVIRQALEMADLENRQVIELRNPSLPAETPPEGPRYWFDPKLNGKASVDPDHTSNSVDAMHNTRLIRAMVVIGQTMVAGLEDALTEVHCEKRVDRDGMVRIASPFECAGYKLQVRRRQQAIASMNDVPISKESVR